MAVSDDIPFEAGERVYDLGESFTWNSDFEIAVFTSEPADKQVQRPPGCDIPAWCGTREPCGDFRGCPGVPESVAILDR